MGHVVHSMTMSLDGYIADPSGAIDWSAPDEELHQFHNDRVAEVGVHLLGRRLYETMVYWETADQDPSAGEIEREFAAMWQRLPKVVFSHTLDHVEGNTRLARGSLAEEVAAAREQAGDRDVAIGGATLAGAAMREGLVDQLDMFVAPVVLGGGTPFFPPLDARQDFELVDTRRFGIGVVHMRYRRR